MRAAVYARYSSDNQREESIDAQLRAIEDYCKYNNIIITKTYIDKALTATSDKRPSFQQMIKDSALDLFDVVVVHKLDRFARNSYDNAIYKNRLNKNGIRIVSVLENLDGSPESGMLESVLIGMAEYYSTNLGREVMKGMKENALNCKHTGGKPPLGYNIDHNTMKLVINEDEAHIVKLIFDLYAKGNTYSTILLTLQKFGYKTKFGGIFGKNSLHSILTNEKYAGTYVYNRRVSKSVDGSYNSHKNKDNKDIIRIENGCPAIIDKEQFDTIQKKIERNRRQAGMYKACTTYILSGLIECGECGHKYAANKTSNNKNRKRTESESIYYYTYRCCSKKNKLACGNRSVRKDEIEDFVLSELESKLFSDTSYLANRLSEYLNKKSTSSQDEKIHIEKQLKETETKISNIIVAISSGIINDSLKSELSRLEAVKANLAIKLNEVVSAKNTIQIDEKMINEILKRFRTFVKKRNLPEIKEFIHSFVQKIVIYPQKTVMFFTIPTSNSDKNDFVVEHSVSLDTTKKS